MADSEIEDLRNIFTVLSDLVINSFLMKRKSRFSKNEYEYTISRP